MYTEERELYVVRSLIMQEGFHPDKPKKYTEGEQLTMRQDK